ncbi:MAG: phage/plasmid primase, P4 family, partial [Nitrososphaerota archaeon]
MSIEGHEKMFVIAKDVEFDDRVIKNFTIFESPQGIEDQILKLKKEDRVFYECVRGPQKMHVDIDIAQEDVDNFINKNLLTPITLDQLADELFPKIIDGLLTFEDYCNGPLYPEDLVICSSHRERKKSWHILINNYYFPNEIYTKYLYQKLIEYLKENSKFDIRVLEKFIDRNVYSRMQQWRLTGCHKINCDNTKEIVNEWKYNDRIIKTSFKFSDTLVQAYGEVYITKFDINLPKTKSSCNYVRDFLEDNIPNDIWALAQIINWENRLNIGSRDWLIAMKVFYRAGNGSERYFNSFDRLCRKFYSNYEEPHSTLENQRRWKEGSYINEKPVTIGTFHYWAKKDNPEKYAQFLINKYYPDFSFAFNVFEKELNSIQIINIPSALENKEQEEIKPLEENKKQKGIEPPVENKKQEEIESPEENKKQEDIEPPEENKKQEDIKPLEEKNIEVKPEENKIQNVKEIDWMNKILYGGEAGLGEICYYHWKDVIISGNDLIFWEGEDKLWKIDNHKDVLLPQLENTIIPYLIAIEAKVEKKEKISKKIKNIRKMLKSTQKRSNILREAYALLRRHRNIPSFRDKLNKTKNLLPIKGGKAINLITGEICDRTKEMYFSCECPVNLGKENPLINQTMLNICGGNEEYCDYLQRVLGYSITGCINEQVMFIPHGSGSNGKSALMSLMGKILGDLYSPVNEKLLIECKKDDHPSGHNEHFRPLVTNRFVVHSETRDGDILNDVVIKKVTGGDAITFRGVCEKGTKFHCQAKLFMCTNHIPGLNNVTDEAMLRRIILLPFDSKFVSNPTKPGEYKDDPELILKLEEELLDDFFYWVVQGSIKYFKKGLKNEVPPCVIARKKEIIKENSIVAQWFDER